MKATMKIRPILKSVVMVIAVLTFLISPAVKYLPAQEGWAVGNKGTILYTADGSKDEWTLQSADKTTPNLNGVSAVNNKLVWAVGNARGDDKKMGAIVYFEGKLNDDLKQIWKFKDSNTTNNLNGVKFVDADHGWAVGDMGTIIFYNGNKWKVQRTGGPPLYGVFFVKVGAKYYGWAVGGAAAAAPTILLTVQDKDGNGAWTPAMTVPNVMNPARSVWLIGNAGVVVGDDDFGAWKSLDGGKTWKQQILKRNGDLRGIQISGRAVWTVGQAPDDVLRSFDGGAFQPKNVPFPGNVNLFGLSFTDHQTGWVVGQKGVIAETRGGGDFFLQTNPQPFIRRQQLNSVVMLPKRPGVQLDKPASPSSGVAGINYISLAASGFPDGGIRAENITVELARECRDAALTTTTAASIVSGSGESQLVSFLLPDGLSPGKYFVSISDSADGDANFESNNCSEVNVTQ